MKLFYKSSGLGQCDQMEKLFSNTWSFITMKTCPKAKIFPKKGKKILPNIKQPLVKLPKTLKICQSGKISANLVTLVVAQLLERLLLTQTAVKGKFYLKTKIEKKRKHRFYPGYDPSMQTFFQRIIRQKYADYDSLRVDDDQI